MSEMDLSKLHLTTTIKYQDFDGSVKEINPQELLAVNRNSLDFESQAMKYYNVMRISESLNLALSNAKQDLSTYNGNLYNKFLADEELITKNNGRKPTDAMIKAKIENDEASYKYQRKVNQLTYQFQIVKNLAKALEQRKDLIQSYSAQLRQENKIGNVSNDSYIN